MGRAVYFANILGVDMGMLREEITTVVNAKRIVVQFLGDSVEEKDVIIVDDMISSGEVTLNSFVTGAGASSSARTAWRN